MKIYELMTLKVQSEYLFWWRKGETVINSFDLFASKCLPKIDNRFTKWKQILVYFSSSDATQNTCSITNGLTPIWQITKQNRSIPKKPTACSYFTFYGVFQRRNTSSNSDIGNAHISLACKLILSQLTANKQIWNTYTFI